MRVAYLCDGRACVRPSCGGDPAGNAGGCRRTTRREHAVNGACDAPETEPGRFVELRPGVYAEKDYDILQCDNKTRERRED